MYRTCTTILITGASSGLGQALAEQYATPGITLALLARDPARLNAVVESCRHSGALVTEQAMDIRDREPLAQWLQEFDRNHPVDLLIANAGIMRPLLPRELHEPVPDLLDTLNTNFAGILNTVFPVLDRMLQRGHGHIAVVSSLSAYHGIPAFPAYSASKAALLNYFQALRPGLNLAGIDLTIICPGYIETPMLHNLPGLKPLIMPATKAAAIIKSGLDRRKPLIVFPRLLHLGLGLLGLLPIRLANWIMIKFYGLDRP